MTDPFVSDTIQYTPTDDPQLDELARRAYEKVQSFGNQAYVNWDSLTTFTPEAKTPWLQAAQAVLDTRSQQLRNKLDAREMLQIGHAVAYDDNHFAAGVPGHGQFILISKLARALGLR